MTTPTLEPKKRSHLKVILIILMVLALLTSGYALWRVYSVQNYAGDLSSQVQDACNKNKVNAERQGLNCEQATQAPSGVTTGQRGPVGPPGPQGPQGVEGPRGLAGPSGPQGLSGTSGTDGQPGTPGANGKPGESGSDGRNGVDGKDGADGAQGPAGPKGDTGPQGPQGEQGVPGPTGPQGPQGEAGTPPQQMTFTMGAITYNCTLNDESSYTCTPSG